MRLSVRFPPLLPAHAVVKAKADSSAPFSAEGLQQMAAPMSILDLSENTNGTKFGGAACSAQPVRMITVNSLEFPLRLWRAAISLKPSFKPLIVFLRECKEPNGATFTLEDEENNYPTWAISNFAFDTSGDCYYVTTSMYFVFRCILYYLQQSRPGTLERPSNWPQFKQNHAQVARKTGQDQAAMGVGGPPAGGRRWGAAAIFYLQYKTLKFCR